MIVLGFFIFIGFLFLIDWLIPYWSIFCLADDQWCIWSYWRPEAAVLIETAPIVPSTIVDTIGSSETNNWISVQTYVLDLKY
ncbi:MAG: hypothetical protein KGL95_03865, partial [Patescibacteria group bacterium]|nr:hypothetical protein [Patescibacteria group bacterium]